MGASPHDSPWRDPANDETLKRLWTSGASAGQIAVEMGQGLSRNSIIGRAHRLGLAGRAVASNWKSTTKSSAPKPARDKSQHDTDRRLTQKLREKAKATADDGIAGDGITDIVEDIDIPLEQRRTLLTLGEDDCRWPCGEPASAEFFYCGAPRAGEHSYCVHHYRRSIQQRRAPPQISDAVRARRVAQGRKNLQAREQARAFGGR